MIIDEGHVSASLNTTITPFTRLLSIERRWIVTGTPTTNLLGLSFGTNTPNQAGIQSQEEVIDDDDADGNFGIYGTPDETIMHTCQAISSRESSPARSGPRIWTKYDREDLNKLGKMITHFVGVPLFVGDPQLVKAVISPLLDRQGPRPGAIQVLIQVMRMVMIRHR